jgi:reactive intermediate/imine deaminase
MMAAKKGLRSIVAKQAVETKQAPAAIGPYSQAVRAGATVYLSGQIPLDPATMQLVGGDVRAEITQVLENLARVATAAGGSLDDIVKLTVYMTDLAHFALVNEIMTKYFKEPYPARAAIGVAALPRNSRVEIDAVLVLGQT